MTYIERNYMNAYTGHSATFTGASEAEDVKRRFAKLRYGEKTSTQKKLKQ